MVRTLYSLSILTLLLFAVSCTKDDFEENKVPVADAGSSKSITLPDSVKVTGSGTDADGKVVAYSWSQVSGPNNSTIVNPAAASTVIKFTVPGSYVFQLMVTDDNGAAGIDTVAVSVSGSAIEGNKVPVVDAGTTKTITLPDAVVLTGTGSDADGNIVAYLWSQVSGPSNSIIVNPGSTTTTIKFDAAGNYKFQLMAVDNKGATGVDTVSVVVNPGSETKTLTLQPATNPGEFYLIDEAGVNLSSFPVYDVGAITWTRNGKLFTVRSLLKYDLSSIPASATILSANLYLYSYPSPTSNGNLTDANYGINNSMYLQRVTSNWSTGTATWTNQPSVTTTNQISIPHTSQSMLDLNLDVTNMVGTMVNTNANYGFMLKLQSEQTLTSRLFVSSYNAGMASKHPKLVVTYK